MTSLMDTRPRLTLVVLCLLLWMPGFFTIPPSDRDESRFVQATKQMLETGDFVRIMNGTEARNRKPIGIHWLQVPFAAAAQAAGLATKNPVWPYRIPSALGGLIAVLACFAGGERLVGRRTALLGAAMLAASALLVTEAHIAKTDAALLGATTVAMAILARAYLGQREAPSHLGTPLAATFWLAIGAGALLKGPITPMIAGLTVLALIIADRRAAWLRALRPAWGVPLMLLVVLPWFVAIGLATHGQFFADAVGGDLGRKLTSGDDSHGGPPGLHLLLIPLLLFPATAAIPAGVAHAWRERRAPAIRFLLAWIGPAWLVFELTPTKLPHYTLPLYPALCLLLASGVVHAAHQPLAWRWIGAAAAALVALAFAAAGLGAPWFLHLSPALGLPTAAAAIVAALWAVRAGQPRNAGRAIVACIPLYAAALGWELPRLQPLWIAPQVTAALAAARTQSGTPAAGFASVGYAEPSLMFLAGTTTQWLLANEAATALANGTIDLLLVNDRDLAAVRAVLAARGISPHTVATVPGFNYSRGRAVQLILLTR